MNVVFGVSQYSMARNVLIIQRIENSLHQAPVTW